MLDKKNFYIENFFNKIDEFDGNEFLENLSKSKNQDFYGRMNGKNLMSQVLNMQIALLAQKN